VKGSGEATVIVGAQWGDEGKGKIIDALVPKFDLVVRYQGGNNAGHTVVVGTEKFKMHLLPSGVVRKKRNLIGAGVVVDPRVLKQEIDSLAQKGVRIDEKILGIDFRAHVIFPWHNALDAARDAKKGIGTTGRGIGPAYEDRAARSGTRFEEFVDAKVLEKRVKEGWEAKAKAVKMLEGPAIPAAEETIKEYAALSHFLAPFACDASLEINNALEKGRRVLFEGAQGTFLDNDFGTYPYVTSSHPIAGGACTGAGVGPKSITSVEGVAKAYTTRVGSGPFPTELSDGIGSAIREKGAEYGTTTGRPRRVGWLDIPMLRYADYLNGFTGIHLTKLDVLGGLDVLKICTQYEINGKRTNYFPVKADEITGAKPVYVQLQGFPGLPPVEWRKIAKEGEKKGFAALPNEAKVYVEKVGQLVGVPILSVSVGPERSEIIWAKK